MKYRSQIFGILLISIVLVLFQNCQPFVAIDQEASQESTSIVDDGNTNQEPVTKEPENKDPDIKDPENPTLPSDNDNDFVEKTSTIGCNNWKSKHENWLFCEDFEKGQGNFDSWFKQSDFIGGHGIGDNGRMTLSSSEKNNGSHSVYMPASSKASYQGAELYWRHCEGEQTKDCQPRVGHEQLYYRAYIKFAEDHKVTHHFLSVGGFRANTASGGTAGCLPNGETKMGTTVDHKNHETFFYTYSPGMSCERSSLDGSNGSKLYTNYWLFQSKPSDTGNKYNRWCGASSSSEAFDWVLNKKDCHCNHCSKLGFPTCTDKEVRYCWGNHERSKTKKMFPKGEWFCFEMMMKPNSVDSAGGRRDGQMAYWINGELAHKVDDMMFRNTSGLKLNRVNLSHYNTSAGVGNHSNRVWFDDVVVSKKRIGCK